tara:strand:- start:127 stop:1098 length:972 start_codon:yes stop_codon:yes gene_type:complete
MARIISYPQITTVSSEDLIPITDTSAIGDPLKNVTVGDLATSISTGIQIPTPQMWVYKSGNLNPYQAVGSSPTLKQKALCISVPTQIDKRWLDNSPRLFLFRYRQSNTADGSGPLKRGNYVHPTHLNGQYIRTNFPGSNWCSSPQYYLDYQTGAGSELFPIITEWDFNGDLNYVQKNNVAAAAITDFKTVNSTAYVEVPLNPLQFIFDKDPAQTQVPFTSFPVTINNDTGFRCLLKKGSAINRFNTNTPWSASGGDSRKAYFKFAIGIPNPTWTNTNKQTPYIMGDLSDAITFQYQENQSGSSQIQAYQIAQGHCSIISRKVG